LKTAAASRSRGGRQQRPFTRSTPFSFRHSAGVLDRQPGC
jgi:hypothetical protein